jgi:hypothetical protein
VGSSSGTAACVAVGAAVGVAAGAQLANMAPIIRTPIKTDHLDFIWFLLLFIFGLLRNGYFYNPACIIMSIRHFLSLAKAKYPKIKPHW